MRKWFGILLNATMFIVVTLMIVWGALFIFRHGERVEEIRNTRQCVQSVPGMCGYQCGGYKCEQYVPCDVCVKYDKEF